MQFDLADPAVVGKAASCRQKAVACLPESYAWAHACPHLLVLFPDRLLRLQGEWKPKMIPNPAYKGPWVHPEVANPEYKEDDSLYNVCKPCAGVGFELWQVKAGTLFDDIIVTDSLAEADAFAKETFEAKKGAEKEAFDAIEKKKRDEEEAARKKAEEASKKAEEEKKAEKEDEEDDEEDKDEL